MDLSKVGNGSHWIFSRFENWKIENQESVCFPARKSRRSSDDLQNPCSKTPAMSSIRDLILLKTNLTKSFGSTLKTCPDSQPGTQRGKGLQFGFQITNGINLSCFCRMSLLILLLTGPYLSSKSFQKFPTNLATVWNLFGHCFESSNRRNRHQAKKITQQIPSNVHRPDLGVEHHLHRSSYFRPAMMKPVKSPPKCTEKNGCWLQIHGGLKGWSQLDLGHDFSHLQHPETCKVLLEIVHLALW